MDILVDATRSDAELFQDYFMLDGAGRQGLGDLWVDVSWLNPKIANHQTPAGKYHKRKQVRSKVRSEHVFRINESRGWIYIYTLESGSSTRFLYIYIYMEENQSGFS